MVLLTGAEAPEIMAVMTIDEIYALPVDDDGWRILPNGYRVNLGDGVKLGDWVWLRDGVDVGDGVTLGDWVTLGNDGVSFAFSPLQIQGSRHLLYVAGPSVIGIGCERHSAEWWLENYELEGRENGYTDAQIAEYKHWLDAAIEWQKTLKKE